MKELDFQELMVELINKKLKEKNLLRKYIARKGKAVLYELTLDENLNLNVKNHKKPTRGQSAFETDVTIFAKKLGVEVPFIILEVKDNISSHDIITYSNKAKRHKTVYPFLRYGLVAYGINFIPMRFFKHNKEIDFFLTLSKYLRDREKLSSILFELVNKEFENFERLQKILHSKEKMNFYQKIPILKDFEE